MRRGCATRWRIPLFCYVALLPVLALFVYVRIMPIGFGFLLSFYRWNLISPRKPFVGWDNYAALLGDDNFQLALKNTTIYSLSTVLISTALALPLAVFLRRRSRLSAFYQTVYFLPVITPLVPMSIAWKWIYDYNYGVLNYGLSLVGLPSVAWLTDPGIALWALVIMGVWKVLGYNLVLFLVGLRNIPAEYHGSRRASTARRRWQRFWRVTLPLLKPILLYRARHRDHQRVQRVHPGLRDDAGLAIGAGPGGADAGVRHLHQRLPVLPHGLRLGRGGHADADRARAHLHPVHAWCATTGA